MESFRLEYGSGLPVPSPGDLSSPGMEPRSPAWQADSLPLSHLGSPSLTMDLIKSISLQGQICQRIKHRSLPQLVKGQLAHGKLPEQIWQIDYICPLILDKGCPYVCTAVNIYSGYLVTIPFRRVNQTNTIKTI